MNPSDVERLRKCFGEFDSVEAIDKAIAASIYTVTLGAHDGALMLAMSYLSDVQELLADANGRAGPRSLELARQWLNIAKHIISTRMERKPMSNVEAPV